MLQEYNVVDAAGLVVEERLALLQDLYDLKQIQMEIKSRLVCRCPSCRSEQATALAWLRSLREQDSMAS